VAKGILVFSCLQCVKLLYTVVMAGRPKHSYGGNLCSVATGCTTKSLPATLQWNDASIPIRHGKTGCISSFAGVVELPSGTTISVSAGFHQTVPSCMLCVARILKHCLFMRLLDEQILLGSG
jgi:hypothetical protein